MDLPTAIRDLDLTPVQIGLVTLTGLVTLVLGFKIAKLVFKLTLLLVALGCLGFALLWLLGGLK